jgi:fructose/tagatose bisphosphate aldolase
VVGGEEDGIGGDVDAERLYTTNEDLLRVAEVLGTDGYLLAAVADHVLTHYDGVLRVDGTVGDRNAFDPRAWGARAEEAMAARVARECERLGSAGRSLLQEA